MHFAEYGVMVSSRHADKHNDLARRVLAYLDRHDGAMDSLEGIARFWLNEEPSVVAPCLEDLHARGRLEVRNIAGVPYYARSVDDVFELEEGTASGGPARSAHAEAPEEAAARRARPAAPGVREAERHYAESLSRMILAAEDLHAATSGHTRRVVRLSGAVARTLRLPADGLDALHQAASLHELGRTVLGLTSSERHTFSDSAIPGAAERLLCSVATLRPALRLLRAAAIRGEAASQRSVETDILAVVEEFVRRVPAGAAPAVSQQAVFSLARRPGQCLHREVLTALGDLVTLGETA